MAGTPAFKVPSEQTFHCCLGQRLQEPAIEEPQIRQWWGSCGSAELFFFSYRYRWRFLIQSDPKAFQFAFDNLLIVKRLKDVKHDEDQVTCPCNGNDWRQSELSDDLTG